jgi:hypothetical protein
MRDDQQKQLEELGESLMDNFLAAADPRNWTGNGENPAEMTPETRGARNWDVKNANQIGALTARSLDLLDRLRGDRGGPDVPDDQAEAEISRFEKQARDAMKKAGLPVGRA